MMGEKRFNVLARCILQVFCSMSVNQKEQKKETLSRFLLKIYGFLWSLGSA